MKKAPVILSKSEQRRIAIQSEQKISPTGKRGARSRKLVAKTKHQSKALRKDHRPAVRAKAHKTERQRKKNSR